MYEPHQTLADNYRQLAEERGVSLADLAPEHDEHAPALAAWLRSQSTPDATAAPTARRSRGRNKAAADKTETAGADESTKDDETDDEGTDDQTEDGADGAPEDEDGATDETETANE